MKIITGKDGKKFAVVENDSHISKWCEEEGRLDHDQNSLPVILEHIEEGDIVIDVGANIGDHTIAYLDKVMAGGGGVYAFEPNPKAFECLYFNCPEAECFLAALGNKRFTKVGIVESENVGASFVNGEGGIPMEKLDAYKLPVDFIKIDAEGYELEVLRGAVETINKHKPKMWIEVNEEALARMGVSPDYLEGYIEGLGYDLTAFPVERGPQYDVLCLPR